MDLARAAPPEGAFIVELERFHGPLDLLLHLIREQDIDIFDIPIAQITAQFLAAIEGVAVPGLDRAGEFLETAALLVRIKAQMILPRHGDDAAQAEDPRAELVRRLLEYEHFRDAAARMEESERDRRRHYARGFVPPRPPPPEPTELRVSWEDVFGAALTIGERVRARDAHRVTTRAVPLEEKIGLIVATLRRIARVEFRQLVEPFRDRLHTVMTFVAGLELAKRRQVALRQGKPFAALWLYRGKESDETDADH